VNPSISGMRHGVLAALLIVGLPPSGTSQQSARAPEARGAARHDRVFLGDVSRAIDLSARYLESACGQSGRFNYLLDPNSGRQSPSYDIVRHAGAMYALAMLNRLHPDSKAIEAMARAAAFLRANYIGPDERSGALVVWSRPLPTKSDADLAQRDLGWSRWPGWIRHGRAPFRLRTSRGWRALSFFCRGAMAVSPASTALAADPSRTGIVCIIPARLPSV